MPTYRITLFYENATSGLVWTLRNFAIYTNPTAAFTGADTFNTAYMAIVPPEVQPIACRVSDEAIFRDMHVAFNLAFSLTQGQAAGEVSADAVAALWRGYGNSTNMGSSAWHFHGISDTFMLDGALLTAAPDVVTFGAACQAYFKQFRKVATPPTAHSPGLPVVNPPASFGYSTLLTTLYNRKLGRPFSQPGQQHAYLRA